MRMGDIAHMYIIPDAGSVAGGIICSKYFHLRNFADGGLGNGRNQVGGPADREVHRSIPVGCAPTGIKIAKKNAFGIGGFCKFVDDLFTHLLGISIR